MKELNEIIGMLWELCDDKEIVADVIFSEPTDKNISTAVWKRVKDTDNHKYITKEMDILKNRQKGKKQKIEERKERNIGF